MNLSNRLTFSLIFSVVLFAVFALTVAPAMAQTTVTVSATHTPDDASTTDTDEERLVVKFTYSRDASPEPVAADFTVGDTALTETQKFAKANNDKKNYTITIEGEGSVIDLNLAGWLDVDVATSGAGTTDDPIVITITPDIIDPTDPTSIIAGSPSAATAMLTVDPDYLAPDAFLVISNNDTPLNNDGAVYPTLPTITPAIVKRAWFNHDGDDDTNDATDAGAMPDLYALFQVNGGGTLNLSAMYDHDNNTETDMVELGSQNLVINEVMWAYDNQHVGSAARTQEQWIEVLNRSTRPFPLEGIVLTASKDFPAPDEETDRLSNIPSFTNTWNITGKGQHGNSGRGTDLVGQAEFISMHRTNHGDGSNAGHWAAAGDYFLPNYKGTPGAANTTTGVQGTRTAPGTDTPPKNTFVINEIGNMSEDTLDWIELKNIHADPQSLKNWALSLVTAFNNEKELYRFPDKTIPSGGIVLLVNKAPKETALASGFNLEVAAIDQDFGIDENINYLIVDDDKLAIPPNNDWLLVLRNGNPWDVKDGRNVYDSGHRVQDVAGAAAIKKQDINEASPAKEKKGDGAGGGDIWQTTHFPLNGHNLGGDKILRHDRDLSSNVWARNTGKQGYERHAFNKVGFTGIGYDRDVVKGDANGGTPGYDNGVAKAKISDVSGSLVISELMLTTDNGRYPQWIELQNTSKTHGINLTAEGEHTHGDTKHKHRWQINIENHNSGTWQSEDRPLNVTINLQDWFTYIPPNQSVLIVAFASSTSDNLPENRVANVTISKRAAFKMSGRRDMFLNTNGFHISIEDSAGATVDEVGNLDGKAFNTRAGIGLDDPVGFDWPADLTEAGIRTSLIRLKDGTVRGVPVGQDGSEASVMGTAGTPRVGVPTRDADGNATDSQGGVVEMGSDSKMRGGSSFAWVHASDLDMVDVGVAQKTYYGASTDIGTPLHTARTPLPVSLSFFRPTLEDGKVVIRWTTESELDNAGFNILRSEDRNGEFTKVNEQLVQGKGTTAERSTYKWVDSSAKPGAVYYYQIEDVSFAGERNTLTTTKLKGLISAKNKLTTTWSELKSQN